MGGTSPSRKEGKGHSIRESCTEERETEQRRLPVIESNLRRVKWRDKIQEENRRINREREINSNRTATKPGVEKKKLKGKKNQLRERAQHNIC